MKFKATIVPAAMQPGGASRARRIVGAAPTSTRPARNREAMAIHSPLPTAEDRKFAYPVGGLPDICAAHKE
jgi:hypothetical protein